MGNCKTATVNRALGVVALVWVLIPIAAIKAPGSGPQGRIPVAPLTLQAPRPGSPRAAHAGWQEPCELSLEQALLPSLCVAFTQPKKKRVRWMDSR